MSPFKLTVKAKRDLIKIARHTEKNWGRDQRKHYLKDFDDAFHLVAKNPSIGIECEFIKKGYKKFPQGSHILYYKLGSKTKVEIIRILHKRMDILSNFTGS